MPKQSVQTSPPLERYVPLRDVATALSAHPRTISRLVAQGIFPKPVRIGAHLRWRQRDVTAYLESLQKTSVGAPHQSI